MTRLQQSTCSWCGRPSDGEPWIVLPDFIYGTTDRLHSICYDRSRP
jgi:hypothetical protein